MPHRRLVLQMGMSLDGIVAIPLDDRLMPVMEAEWGLPPEEPELTKLKVQWVSDAGAHLMGRATYQEMAAYWPRSTHVYAAPMNDIPKVVFSNTLEHADWPESQIARGDLAEEIGKLKQQAGRDLMAHGGAAFAQALVRNDLIDEYRLITHPVAVGAGRPLFKDLQTPLPMELIDAKTFGGTVVRVYQRA